MTYVEFYYDRLSVALNLRLQGWISIYIYIYTHTHTHTHIGGPFEKFVDWRQCAAVMQRKSVTVISSCSSEGNIVVVCSLSL
jgi:hypothetical protein